MLSFLTVVAACADDDSVAVDAGHADDGGGSSDGGGADAGRSDGGADADGGGVDDAGADAAISDAAGPDAAGPDAAWPDAAWPDGGPLENPCRVAGGICATTSADCASGGGTLAPAGDAGCHFDDGDGVCCIPPAPEPSGDSCVSHGGICASVSGCNFVGGQVAPPIDCGGPPFICCVPETACGPEAVVCCGDSTSFRPHCDRGTFSCDAFPGTTLVPIEDC